MYGYDPATPVPSYTDFEQFFTPDSWGVLSRTVARTVITGKPYELELELIRNDGRKGWLWAKGIPVFGEKQQVVGIRGIVQDITEKKEKEERIVFQNTALKKANFELDNFVYRVSHDLRAPILSSLGLTEISLGLDPKDEVHDLLKKQLKSLNKLDKFIKDILNYSRNTRLDVQKSQLDFGAFIREIIDQHNSTEHAIEVRVLVAEEMVMFTDETRLTMVFNNLVSNAFKFAAPYKENSFIEITGTFSSTEATFTVRDNGIGIKQEYLGDIFGMFFRATDTNYGSGLGLYITKEAVEKLGGQITVESEYGEGTTFTVTLPNSCG
jgi:signal transduction histidine kinase